MANTIDRLASAINGNGGTPEILYGTYVAPETADANLHQITILGTTFRYIPSSMSLRWWMQRIFYTSNATFTKANYKNLFGIRVEVVGGGGAGGGAEATGAGQWSFGDGGGAGEYAEGFFLASALGANETIALGTGGTGGTGAGTAGAPTTFGSLISAAGGGAGAVRPAGTSPFSNNHSSRNGGSGGTGGDFRARGTAGGSGLGVSAVAGVGQRGGDGGSSKYGAGGLGASNTAGFAGNGYGSGGGGASRGASLGAVNGGNGTPGICVIDLYGGPAVGSTVVLLKTGLVPLTIIGVLAGNNTLATV